jgi:hypothetical protein
MVRKFKYDLQNKIEGKTGAVERGFGAPRPPLVKNSRIDMKFGI